MGVGGIGIWQLLIILLIVVMLFGTKKLRNLGSDLGGALKGFKTAMSDEDEKEGEEQDSESGEKPDTETVEAREATETGEADAEKVENK